MNFDFFVTNTDFFLSFSFLPWGMQASLIFIMGLCVGSFLNVVIYRMPRGRSMVRPGSRCGFCRSSISPFMNIPVLSFLASQGCCAKCGVAFSVRYPVVEILNAFLYLSLFRVYDFSPHLLVFCIFSSALLAISFIDLEFKIIPDALSVGGCVAALIFAAVARLDWSISLGDAIWGALLGYGLFFILSRAYAFVVGEEGLGGGDLKLMAFIGAVLGARGVLTSIVLGSLLGSVVGVISILYFKKSKKFPIPFGPFLAIGAYAAVFRLDEFFWP